MTGSMKRLRAIHRPVRHWLIAAGFAGIACLSGCGLPSGRTLRAIAAGPPVDPERYRASIESVELVLFRDGPVTEDGRESLSVRIADLGSALAEGDSSALVHHFRGELVTLARMARNARMGQTIERTPLRTQWERIRGSLFDDASWFAWSQNDLSSTDPSPDGLLRVDEAEGARLERVMDQLDIMLDRAPRDLRAIHLSTLPSVATASAVATGESWSGWSRAWHDSLAGAGAGIPSEPTLAASASFDAAVDSTRLAIATMTEFGDEVGTGDTAAEEAWKARYDEAVRRLGAARESLRRHRELRRIAAAQ
jgi:hypothetical protein